MCVHVQTTWKAVEDKMMEKVMNEIKNVEKRLKRQFKKDTQLFVDGALLILMRNVEDMTVRKMMESPRSRKRHPLGQSSRNSRRNSSVL
jgi:hypothetical protein